MRGNYHHSTLDKSICTLIPFQRIHLHVVLKVLILSSALVHVLFSSVRVIAILSRISHTHDKKCV